MTDIGPVELPNRTLPFFLGWICACSPLIVLFVVFTALVRQTSAAPGSFAVIEDFRRATMRPVLDVAWSASMMFAVYLAGPTWITLLCVPRFRLSWKVHSLQAVTLAVGWLIIWILLIRRDDILSRIP
jgi:hypothetical protein